MLLEKQLRTYGSKIKHAAGKVVWAKSLADVLTKKKDILFLVNIANSLTTCECETPTLVYWLE